MTNDLVQWLRENTEMWDHDYDMQTAAADRIEKLESLVKELLRTSWDKSWPTMRKYDTFEEYMDNVLNGSK